MSKYYTIKITGGTSPGPYTIYLNTNPGPIPFISGTTTPAENLTLGQLFSPPNGVTVKVPDDTEIIYLYNQLCPENPQPLIPPVNISYESFCLSFESSALPNVVYKHFIPNGMVGGYPSWISDTTPVPNPPITITWNSTNNIWVMNNYGPSSTQTSPNVITSSSPSDANPPSGWASAGGSAYVYTTLLSNEVCPTPSTSGRSTFPVSINQPTCFCDGSIVFNVNLDNPPYSYSIDNGVTYSSSPIFTNLCSGIYLLSVSDYLGNVFSKTITIDKPEMATTYTLSLNTTKTTPIINEISLVNSYETTVTVTPPLPDGTTITFDLIHDNNFYSSPTSGTSVLTTGTILNSNFTTIPVSLTSTGNTKSVNTTPGCQSDFIYQSDINEVWNSITFTNTDTIVISTTTRVDKTTTGLCVVGYSNDTYSISNAIISGCDCCSLIVNA